MSTILKRLQLLELSKSGLLYRKVIENLPQRISVKDTSLAYVFCNEAFAQDLNITPDEILGKRDHDLFPRELAEKMIAEENGILSSGVRRDVEEKYVVFGKELTVRSTKSPIRSDNGDIIGLQVILQDITRDKFRAESLAFLSKNLETQLLQKEIKFDALRMKLERMTDQRNRLEDEIEEMRTSMKKQTAVSDATTEKLNNDLQQATIERKEIIELLRKVFTQIQVLMNAAEHLTVLSSTRGEHCSNEQGL